jgi:ATP-binding cassette subfamily B protein/subfamily B ATP-binding cassette protein MsbA
MIHAFKRLLPYLRPLRREITLMFLFGIGVTLISGVVPMLVQLLFEIYNRSNMETFQRLLPTFVVEHLHLDAAHRDILAGYVPFMFPVIFLLLGTIRFVHNLLINYTSERIIAAIRVALVRKVLRLNLSYLGSFERGSGGLISRVFNDPILLQQGLNFTVDLIREPIQGAIYITYMMILDWRLTLCSLLFLPFFLVIMRAVTKSLRKYGAVSRESMEDLSSVFKDSVDGVRVVQSFNLEGEMMNRFQSRIREYLHTALKIIMRENAVSPINEFLVSFLLLGFGIYSIDQVLGGTADSARFIGFIAAAGFLQAPIKKLQDAGVKIQQAVVVTERIFSILEGGDEVPEVADPRPFPVNWQKITFKNVSFSYGQTRVLKNVNLEVRRGEIVALVGESGSGKSTLVNLLERFYDPTEGEILVDDVPIKQIALKDLRHNVALVTQDVFLFRDSIEKNIQAGDFDKPISGVVEAAKFANAHNFISAMPRGYQSPVGERGNFLSGGEKQRVSIARAIFKNAPILILDEATSALDSVSEVEVQRGLEHLLESRTAFVIAHRLSTVFNSDRILVMKNGEIVEEGSHDDLLSMRGAYHSFFELQMNFESRVRT